MSEQQPSQLAIRIAAGLVVLLVIGVVIASQLVGQDEAESPPTTTPPTRTGPLALVAVDAPAAKSTACTTLTGKLPEELPNADTPLHRLPLADPAPPAAMAWGADRGEPVVLRCGLSRPSELTPTASLLQIDKVKWLKVEGAGSTTWFVVDRGVYIATTVPEGTGTGPLQEISATVAKNLKPAPIRTS